MKKNVVILLVALKILPIGLPLTPPTDGIPVVGKIAK